MLARAYGNFCLGTPEGLYILITPAHFFGKVCACNYNLAELCVSYWTFVQQCSTL